jgi:hypothetical protein
MMGLSVKKPIRPTRRHSRYHLEIVFDRLVTKINRILRLCEVQHMASAEIKAALAKIDTATDNIAADIVRLKEKIGTGMTDAEVAEVQAGLDKTVTKLEGIAADPDNPEPVA